VHIVEGDNRFFTGDLKLKI